MFFHSSRASFLRLSGALIGKNVALHSNVYFFEIGRIQIGSNSTINYGCWLDNRVGIHIGNNVNISHFCNIYTLGHNLASGKMEVAGSKVVIEDDAWIFPRVTIMPGVVIGKGAVVYPCSVVTKNVPEFAIVAGNPAKIVGKRTDKIDYTLDFRVWFAR